MKFTTILGLASAITAVAATPHRHAFRHAEHHALNKRTATSVSVIPGPTVVVYVLNGKEISDSEAEEGIKDGSLVYVPEASSSVEGAEFYVKTSSTSSSSSSTTTSKSSTTTSSASSTKSTSSAVASSRAPVVGVADGSLPAPTGLNTPFPDKSIPCSTFPSEYGAIPVDYFGMGGWIGLQEVSLNALSVSNIVTGVSGSSCSEGWMCSYACPPGYQKSQWPTGQGATGQSIGGISCNNGVLTLTNPGLSSQLCIPGEGGVTVQNTLSQSVYICRTDYPGNTIDHIIKRHD
jgi:hypothetical protein